MSSSGVMINQGRDITIDTNGFTWDINVINNDYGIAVRDTGSSLTFVGGGEINVMAGGVHIAVDVWQSILYVEAGTTMNISNSGTGQVRGIRALSGANVTVRGTIRVLATGAGGAGTGHGVTGIRSRQSNVTLVGSIFASGNYGVGIYTSYEQSTVNVSGSILVTGNSSQTWLSRASTPGNQIGAPGPDTIIIGGQPYAGTGQPVAPTPTATPRPPATGQQPPASTPTPTAAPTPTPTPLPTPPPVIGVAGVMVTVSVRQGEGTADLALTPENVASIIEETEDTVVFDLVFAGVTTVIMPQEAWNGFAEAGLAVELQVPGGVLAFDTDAVASIGYQAQDVSIVASLLAAQPEVLTPVQQDALIEGGELLLISVSSDDLDITEFDGQLTVSVAYDGDLPVAVWAVGEDGSLELLPAQFDSEIGMVTFTTFASGVFMIAPVIDVAPAAARFVIGSLEYSMNGTVSSFEAAPFIDNNRTMIPLRLIGEVLGATFDWDGDARVVTMYLDGASLTLTIGQPLPDGMGAAVIVNNRTFVPMRYVTETLGATVRWDEDAQAVYVYR